MKMELMATTAGTANKYLESIAFGDPVPLPSTCSSGHNADPAIRLRRAAMPTLVVLFFFFSYAAHAASGWVPLNADQTHLQRASELNALRAENAMLRHQLGHSLPAEVKPATVTQKVITVYSPPPCPPVVVQKTMVITSYPSPPPVPVQVQPACPYRSGQWISGTWVSSGNGYVWRSGYWIERAPQPVIVRYYVPTPPRHHTVYAWRDARDHHSNRHH